MKTYEEACDDLRDLVDEWVGEELCGNDCVRALGALVLVICFQQPDPAGAFAEFQKTMGVGFERTRIALAEPANNAIEVKKPSGGDLN